MRWFSSPQSQPAPEFAPAAPAPSQDGGYIAPDRTQRAQCWEGRDNFFKCLDRHSIIDSVRQDDKAKEVCLPELREFEKVCQASWVTYFKKRRVMEHQRDQTIKKLSAEGAQQMSISTK